MRYFLILALMLSGCKVLQKSNARLSSTEQMEVNRNENQWLQYSEWKIVDDSANIESRMEFYPKGKISISPDGRIEGEMDKISIIRKEQKVVKSKSREQLSAHQNTTMSKKSKTELKRVDRQQMKLGFNWLIYLIPIGLVLLICWRIFKTIK